VAYLQLAKEFLKRHADQPQTITYPFQQKTEQEEPLPQPEI